MHAASTSESGTHGSAQHVALEARLSALYDRNVDDIYRFCLARSGDTELAADATAEVFCSAARSFATGTADQVTRPWLFAVAKNKLVDHWRRSSRHERRVERLAASRAYGRPSGDLSDEISIVSAADVVDALQSLPDRQCAALSLRYLEELSVAEIAEELDITYQAAESLLARGRRSFEQAWRNQGLPEPRRGPVDDRQ